MESKLYQDVVNDKTPTAWAVFGYESKTSNKVVVQAKGEGGLDEVKAQFKEDECQFAYVRMTTGDEESKRAKFLFLSWVGEKVSPLRRAKMSVHKADIKAIIRNFALEVHATTVDDINNERILAAMIKAGGANYSSNPGK
jgi:hypothetical protein